MKAMTPIKKENLFFDLISLFSCVEIASERYDGSAAGEIVAATCRIHLPKHQEIQKDTTMDFTPGKDQRGRDREQNAHSSRSCKGGKARN